MSDVEPTEHFEHAEHAEHAAHSGDPFLPIVAITIAILAVIAAFIGSLETIETAATIDAKNEAVLFQDKATDTWNFYQAKSLKKNLYEIAASLAGPGAKADGFKTQAEKYRLRPEGHPTSGQDRRGHDGAKTRVERKA